MITLSVGVANAEFICGKAEDVMPDMSHPQGSEVIGIVDPPRAGLRESGSHSIGLNTTCHVSPQTLKWLRPSVNAPLSDGWCMCLVT